MESNELKSDEKDCVVISKRKLMKALAAVGFAAASPLALADPAPTPFCYGDPAAGKEELTEDTIYPLLAVWLAMTTNPDFTPASNTGGDLAAYTAFKNSLARATYLTPDCVNTILNVYYNNKATFAAVQLKYADLIDKSLATGSVYTGGHCPGALTTITHVVRLGSY